MRLHSYLFCIVLVSAVTSTSWLFANNTSSTSTRSEQLLTPLNSLTHRELQQSHLPTTTENLPKKNNLTRENLGLPPKIIPGSQPTSPEVFFYLNRCIGGKRLYNKGFTDSRLDSSTFLPRGEEGILFPEYPYGDESWNRVVSLVKRMFEAYPHITVTETDPGSEVFHHESIVCGSYELIAQHETAKDVQGISNTRPYSVIHSGMSFVFPSTIPQYDDVNGVRTRVDETKVIAKLISQKIASNYTLDSLHDCGSIMDDWNTYEPDLSENNTRCGYVNAQPGNIFDDLFSSSEPDWIPSFKNKYLPCGQNSPSGSVEFGDGSNHTRLCSTESWFGPQQNSHVRLDSIFTHWPPQNLYFKLMDWGAPTHVGPGGPETARSQVTLQDGASIHILNPFQFEYTNYNGIYLADIFLDNTHVYRKQYHFPKTIFTSDVVLLPITIPAGDYKLTVVLYDIFGYYLSDSRNISIENNPDGNRKGWRGEIPTITVLSPTQDEVVSDGVTVKVAVEVPDTYDPSIDPFRTWPRPHASKPQGIHQVHFAVDGKIIARTVETYDGLLPDQLLQESLVTSKIYSFWVPKTALSESNSLITKKIEVHAYDIYNNTGSAFFDVHVKQQEFSPTVEFTSLKQGSVVYPHTPVSFSARAGNTEGLKSISMYINNSEITHNNLLSSDYTTFKIPEITLFNREDQIDVELRVTSLNDVTTSKTVTVDYVQQKARSTLLGATNPTISVMHPSPNSRVESGFTIEADIHDPDGVKSILFFIDDIRVKAFYEGSEPPYRFTTPIDLTQGKHRIDIIATDPFNISSVESRIVYIGIDPPSSDDLSNPNNDLRSLGEPCTTGNQCASQQCTQDINLCVQSCTTTATCPIGFVCADSTGDTVCIPEDYIQTTASSCSTSGPQNLIYIGLALLGLSIIRRRRQTVQ